jgi:AraC family transcriptional activator of pobA
LLLFVQMPGHIPYFENISDSFQNSNLESISADVELMHFEDIPGENMQQRKPARLNAYVVGLVTGGSASITINSRDYPLQQGTLYFSTPWHIRKYNNISDWKGYVLFFTPQYLFQNLQADSFDREFVFFQAENGLVVMPSGEELHMLEKLFEQMYAVLRSDNPNRFRMLFHYIHILLLECKSLQAINALDIKSSADTTTTLFLEKVNNYFTLLSKGMVHEPLTLTAMAQELHLHPNYLSHLVKGQSGKTVAQIIRERIVLEAQALLKNTGMTVSEISYYLLFKDTSNFAKFFKSNTGMSPSAFREANRQK